ncbi:MAG: helix-turn-helix domain-containing protein [Bacteroidia bacterium]|nr:helix-turn-helix domain-containing protein [Bacteroidia bacterium]
MADTKKLKKAAEIMFIEQGKQQKEIAQTLGVSEKTLSNWAKAGKWKEKRIARMNSAEKRTEDIKQVIGSITERRLEIAREIVEAKSAGDKKLVAALQIEAVAIGQEVAMYSKALQVVEKDNKPTLAMYLQIMDEIFRAMQAFSPSLHLQTLDFQESHLADITEKLA